MASLRESAPLRSYGLALPIYMFSAVSLELCAIEYYWNYFNFRHHHLYHFVFDNPIRELQSINLFVQKKKKKLLALISQTILLSLNCSGEAYSYAFARQSGARTSAYNTLHSSASWLF